MKFEFFLNTDILFHGVLKGYVDLVKFEMPRGNYKINDEFIFNFDFFNTIST